MQSIAPITKALLETPRTLRVKRASRSIPREVQWRLLYIPLILMDVVMTGTAFRLAFYFRFEMGIPLFYQDVAPSLLYYQSIVMVILLVWVIIYALVGLYNRNNLLGGTREYALVFNASTMGMFAVIAAGFLLPDFIFARGWLLLAWGLSFILAGLGRFLIRRLVYSLREFGYFLSTTIIVGANDEGFSLAKQLSDWKASGMHILGIIDNKLSAGAHLGKGIHVLGSVVELDTIVQKSGVEEIILASSAFSSRDSLLQVFKTYGVVKGINVRMSSGLYEIITTGLTVKEFASVPLVHVNEFRLSGADRFMKLLLDYSLTIPGLILISPILLVIAIAIRLDSPGPIIHRRRVMGVNGKQFDAYKFRSMHANGDEILASYPELEKELTENHKLKEDPRVTRVGLFLRKTSLDELPQLFNVLKGEMSLVGPRMISPAEISEYDQWDINLLTVPPGITGLWQVSGRSDVTYEQRVRYDMHYIRNWSIWMDLQILYQTLPAVLNKRGAY